MSPPPTTPRSLASRSAGRLRRTQPDDLPVHDAFRRETYTLPRQAARAKAREWFSRFPREAYMTEIEFWRELPDDRIEFTMRRLPTAD